MDVDTQHVHIYTYIPDTFFCCCKIVTKNTAAAVRACVCELRPTEWLETQLFAKLRDIYVKTLSSGVLDSTVYSIYNMLRIYFMWCLRIKPTVRTIYQHVYM